MRATLRPRRTCDQRWSWLGLLSTPEFSACYTVFSGGDDLFIVGPWDQTLLLARKVREDFRRWVGRDDLTLSAGLVFGSPSLPMSQAAAETEEELDGAKDAGRDRISVLGRTITWDRYTNHILARWQGLLSAVTTTSSSSLFRLMDLGRMWEKYLENPAKNVSALRAHPLLAYAVARDSTLQRPPYDVWLAPAVRLAPLDQDARATLDDMALVAELLIYSKRKEA